MENYLGSQPEVLAPSRNPFRKIVRRHSALRALALPLWTLVQEKDLLRRIAATPAPRFPASGSSTGPAVPAATAVRNRESHVLENGNYFSAEVRRLLSERFGHEEPTASERKWTDKFEAYGFQFVYGPILAELKGQKAAVLEIGIGVPDASALSGMHDRYTPGTSLIALKEFLGNAEVHGADIDRRVLVDTEFYTTHFIDQLDESTLERFAAAVQSPFDLIIDDGLHTPQANANCVAWLLPLLSSRGVLVIEDIVSRHHSSWKKVERALPPGYSMIFYSPSDLHTPSGKGLGPKSPGLAVFWRR